MTHDKSSNNDVFVPNNKEDSRSMAPENFDESNQTSSEIIQSPARPLGLDIIDIVKSGEHDVSSRDFLENGLPAIESFLDDLFNKDRENIIKKSPNLDLNDLLLKEDADVRVYFIKEGAVYHNSLGFEMAGKAQLIFPDASSAISYHNDMDTRAKETREDIPLLRGDFVDLGRIPKGTPLDFFLIKDGARNENGETYWTRREDNIAEFNHIKLHGVYNDNTFVIGFEDVPKGGDKDFDDVVVAVEITNTK